MPVMKAYVLFSHKYRIRQEKFAAYGSKMLTKTECNYCLTRKELLAVIHFVSTVKYFLLGCKFLIWTVSCPLLDEDSLRLL